MKENRVINILIGLGVLMTLMMFSVGRWIMGGIMLLLTFGIYWNRGSGKFNDRSIYENVVKTEITIDELFELLKDMDTPLGKPWIGGHKGFKGDSIVFGPNIFKDCVVISQMNGKLNIKHLTLVDNILRDESEEYRFSNFLDPKETEVTPKRYAIFASFKLASIMLIRDLRELIEALDKNRNTPVPERMGDFTFYYHNSSEGTFRDEDDNELLKVESILNPFSAKVFDMDGEEMASVVPRAYNAKGVALDTAGFEIFADGEHYGEITRYKTKHAEGYRAVTEAGEFDIRIMPACRRGNLSCNYVVEQNGVRKAVIGGSPNLLFDEIGYCQSDIVLSYDDDLFVLFAALEIFILTYNKKFLK